MVCCDGEGTDLLHAILAMAIRRPQRHFFRKFKLRAQSSERERVCEREGRRRRAGGGVLGLVCACGE